MNMYQKELMHYGIMGMHWGIRRYQPYPSWYKGEGKFVGSDKQKKALAKDIRKQNAYYAKIVDTKPFSKSRDLTSGARSQAC